MTTLANKEVALIGYSGHSYVVCDILLSQCINLIGYCEENTKNRNPYNLNYLGNEKEQNVLQKLKGKNWFVGIGDNKIREKVTRQLLKALNSNPISAIHKNASISTTAKLSYGVMVGDGAVINACSQIGEGVICNTSSVIEHECTIGDYVHIAPGAILCGNVTVGDFSFIGAGSVIKEGVNIGKHATIGAGSVIIKDIPDNSKVVGNPQRVL